MTSDLLISLIDRDPYLILIPDFWRYYRHLILTPAPDPIFLIARERLLSTDLAPWLRRELEKSLTVERLISGRPLSPAVSGYGSARLNRPPNPDSLPPLKLETEIEVDLLE